MGNRVTEIEKYITYLINNLTDNNYEYENIKDQSIFSLGIDSVTFVFIIVELEEKLGIKIESAMTNTGFDTLKEFCEFFSKN